MKKKILSVVLAIAILSSAGYAVNRFGKNGEREVFAGEYRGGFLLLPDDFDNTGVNSGSAFTLKSQIESELSYIVENFVIDGQEKPTILLKSENTYTIIPKEPFAKNKLYTFRLKNSVNTEITWTFQTSALFSIAGSLPANKTTNVPIDTGIEIYFSHSEYQNPDDYFEITPAVKGKFERHNNAYVFVPLSNLDNGTLYTITIKKGIKTTDGKTEIANDYSFSFETALTEKDQKSIYNNGYIFFNKVLNEYTTIENPYLPINYSFYNVNNKKTQFIVTGTVYSYKTTDDFMKALDKKSTTPIWAYYSYLSKNFVDTNKLSKVITFENELKQNPTTTEDNYLKIPSNLPAGYYIVDCTCEDIRFQTFIQITDIGIYMTADDDSMLVWLNDLKTKKPLVNAKIDLYHGDAQPWITNEQGIVLFDYDDSKFLQDINDPGERYFKIEATDGRTAVLRRYINNYSNDYKYSYLSSDMMNMPNNVSGNDYWRYIQLDRSLYKPNDTVFFWGFLKNRYENVSVAKATVEIGKADYYSSYSSKNWSIFPMFTNEPVAKTTVDLSDGSFDGKIELPYLEPGNYTLQIRIGGEIVSNANLTVQNYTKPAYKMVIEKNKKAVFWYEPVEFKVKTAFFEGTKVPGLDITYNFNSNGNSLISNTNAKTDENGEYKKSVVPGIQNDRQGELQGNFSAFSSLPETGEINDYTDLRIFANDINVAINAKITTDVDTQNKKGRIDFKINNIILDRINNESATSYDDYLGTASTGRTISGSIVKNRWIKYENGTYYDFINKKTTKRYDYKLTKETVATFNILSDSNGACDFLFDAPDISDGYYTYEVFCKDNKDLAMHFSSYIGEQWYRNGNYINYEEYYLDGAKEKYPDGSDVKLEFKKGLEILPESQCLYIKSQNGIMDYLASSKSTYEFKMTEECRPNVYVKGVYFNGTTYIESADANIVYDFSEKDLIIKARTDKESYKPGEEVTIKINAQDKGGKGVKAIVNAGIVDEALFELQDMSVATLASLYEYVPSGINTTYASHINSGMDLVNGSTAYNGMDSSKQMSMTASGDKESISKSPSVLERSATTDKGAVRENFADTALFKTVILNENGEGEIKFTLPDNITSWRVTLTGISSDLDAGSNTETLKVTLPFFINYAFNSTYLVGDKAFVGVTGYGDNLVAGDSITYKVSTSSNPADIKIVTGKAFERTNILVGELSSEDKYILIEAESGKGDKDAMKQIIDVKTSYHEINESVFYNLSAGLQIGGGKDGNTRLIFMDKGRGMYYPGLQSFLWQSGNRIDQQVSRVTAQDLLKKYFDTDNEYLTNETFKASDYQTSDGGISILPYGPSDLELSAKITPFIKNLVDETRLKQYFYAAYEDESISGLKTAALYGLAVLGQPVLLEIGKASKVENASIKDLLYLCLAYCELGEQPQAQKLYNEKISQNIKQSGTLKYIDSGTDKDDVLETTALGFLLAKYFDEKTSDNFYEYCKSNSTKDILINIETLSFIKTKIEKASNVTGKFTYTFLGETKEVVLEKGKIEYKDIPSISIGDFKIDSVTGEVALISVFKNSPTSFGTTDPEIKVSRRYFNTKSEPTNTFTMDDVVKVEIKVEFGVKATDGSYEITDYLPSGLKAIENTWMYGTERSFNDSWYGRINGQKISFNLYNYNNTEYSLSGKITYYARVTSTGTYLAESPIIQGNGNASVMIFGERTSITIK